MVNYFKYTLNRGELVGGGPRRAPSEAIFIAYSFNSKESIEFRTSIEQAICRTSSLSHLNVIDGQVPVGKNWSTTIHDQLKRAKLVVADLTVLSPEVLFECGFAWGLGRPILPVTKELGLNHRLPRWLTDLQVGYFATEKGVQHLLDSIAEHLTDTRGHRLRAHSAGAMPSSVVLLRPTRNQFDLSAQVQQSAARFGLATGEDDTQVEAIESISSALVEEVAHCSLLVAPLQNDLSDSFVHFACGVIASEPKSGAIKPKLSRRVLLVVKDGNAAKTLPADSARRLTGVIRVVLENQISAELIDYGSSYQSWLKKQEAQT